MLYYKIIFLIVPKKRFVKSRKSIPNHQLLQTLKKLIKSPILQTSKHRKNLDKLVFNNFYIISFFNISRDFQKNYLKNHVEEAKSR